VAGTINAWGLKLRKPATPVVALAIGATLLGGCGGSDEDSTSTAVSEGSSPKSATAQKPGKPGSKEKQGDSAETAETAGSAPTSSASLPNEGTKEVAPGVPTVKGGDNSIQEYGTEGPSEERVQAAAVLQEYLDARAARNATKACSYIADQAKRELAQLAERAVQPQGKKKEEKVEVPTCTDLIGKIVTATPKKDLRREADINVRSMRIEDGRAFLVYEDGEGAVAQIAMVDEDGEWRVAVLAGAALIPAGAGAPS
jgi:hypothetical protein